MTGPITGMQAGLYPLPGELWDMTVLEQPAPAADISRFFTNMDRSVYALKNLPEEVVAYLFARYSRVRLSLREDLRNMIEAEDWAR